MDVEEIPSCPNCSKLTYGPLTEEMVAEALYDAGHASYAGCYHKLSDVGGAAGYYERQARFVLRMLERMYPYKADACYIPKNRFHETDWRNWLLKIARES